MSENYTITRRPNWSHLGDLTVTIDCDPLTPTSTKLGLAVKVALTSRADLSRADLTGADLTGANLSGADLTRAYLTDANLSGADLTGASLSRADLSRADLTGADLTGASLRGANLSGASLRGANLSRADLTGANLSRADLTGALIRDEPVERLIAQVNRQIDPYTFLAFRMLGQSVKVLAGCRWFSVQEFRDHVASQYPDTPKAVETLDILNFIEIRASREASL